MLLSRRNRAVATQISTTAIMTPAHRALPIPGRCPGGITVRASAMANRTTLAIAKLLGEDEKNAGLRPGAYPVHGWCAYRLSQATTKWICRIRKTTAPARTYK